jgi:HrpA-like RNA helicase
MAEQRGPTILHYGTLKEVPDACRSKLKTGIAAEVILDWIKVRSPETNTARSRLPPNGQRDRILVLRSETGSGKSTALPPLILRWLRGKRGPKDKYGGRGVLCTQPTRLTAEMIARDGAESEHYPDMVMGETIGYNTGLASEAPKHGGLVYATTDTLLAQLRTWTDRDFMNEYHTIIIDEAHRRSQTTDIVLMKLKGIYLRNRTNKALPFLIIASATIDVERYLNYFQIRHDENFFWVTGRAFPIEDHFLDKPSEDYVADIAARVEQICRENTKDAPKESDIMIFFPGKRAMRDLEVKLKDFPDILLMTVMGEDVKAQSRDYRRLQTSPVALGVRRKIIMVSDVAETGLTVDTIKYVIDAGWAQKTELHPELGGTKGLIIRPTTQNSAMQRRGRCGRKFPGVFYAMYTQSDFDELAVFQLPELFTQGTSGLLLDMIKDQIMNKRVIILDDPDPSFLIKDIDMLDPPPPDLMMHMVETVNVCGFAHDNGTGFRLTEIGELASRFGGEITLEQIKMIMCAPVFGVSVLDMIGIAVMMGADKNVIGMYGRSRGGKPADLRAIVRVAPIWLQRGSNKATYYATKMAIGCIYVEGLMVYNDFARAVEEGTHAEWCHTAGIKMPYLVEMTAVRDGIISDCIVAGLEPFLGDELQMRWTKTEAELTECVRRIKRCIYEGYKLRVLTRRVFDVKKDYGAYYTRQGVKVSVAGLQALVENACIIFKLPVGSIKIPKHILPHSIKIEMIGEELTYKLRVESYSVLDGWIAVDHGLLNPMSLTAEPNLNELDIQDAKSTILRHDKLLEKMEAQRIIDGSSTAPPVCYGGIWRATVDAFVPTDDNIHTNQSSEAVLVASHRNSASSD